MEKISRLIISFLFAAIIWSAGCATPDPLAGFHFCSSQDPHKLDKAIQDDYQNYIQKLPPEERRLATYDNDFEDGTGQHAILITVGIHDTNYRHVLIYDKNNKRIKKIKY